MPFKSKAQQRFMFSQHPEMAKRWAEHTPDIKSLPEKVDSDKEEKKGFVTAEELGRFTAFSEKLAALDPAAANALGLGGAGALAGGGLGALGGLIEPGHYYEEDKDGIIQKRQKSRLGQMFSRGLSGALIGGGLGGGIGYAGTELMRPMANIKLRQDVEDLQNSGKYLAELKGNNILDNLKNSQRIAANNLNLMAAQLKQKVFENSPRNVQHELIAQHLKSNPDAIRTPSFTNLGRMVYSNPFATGANQAYAYYNQKIAPYLK